MMSEDHRKVWIAKINYLFLGILIGMALMLAHLIFDHGHSWLELTGV